MKLVEEVNGLVSSKIKVLKTIFSIIKLETRLASLSVLPLVLNLCMFIIVLITVWVSCMLLLGYFALSICNIPMVMGSILLLNVLILVGLVKYMSYNLRKMSFEKTRALISKRENK